MCSTVYVFKTVFKAGNGFAETRPMNVTVSKCVSKYMEGHNHTFDILDFEFIDEDQVFGVVRHLHRTANDGVFHFSRSLSNDLVKFDLRPE